MASQNIARLGVVLALDTAEFTASIDKAISENTKLKNAIRRDTNSAAGELITLIHATEDYGKALTKVELIQREVTSGKYMNATKDIKDRLLQQAAAYDKIAMSAKNAAGAQFKMNEQQKIQLTYQTTDFFTQIASGQSPFLAAFQQGGQLKDVMGGVGNMFKAIGSLFTPFSVGLGTVAGAFGAVAFAIYEADQEFDNFQNSLTLTGNYAGVTAKDLVAMSTAIAGTVNTTIGKATDALDALVASGKFTKISLDSVTSAVLVYAKIAGVDGKTAAEKLMSGLDGTAASAKQLNDKMNFLTLEQYKQIQALDKAGKKQEAAKLAADILTERLEAQKRILGLTEGAWQKATVALSGYWDTFKKAFFSGESPEDKLERMNNQIQVLQIGLRNATGDEPFFVSKTKELEALLKRRDEFADLMNERDQSIVAPDQKGKISDDATYGEMIKSKNIEVQKAISAAAFAEAKTRQDEIARINHETADKIENARLEMNEKNRKEEFRAASQNLSIFLNNEKVINAEAAEKIKQIRIKRYMEEQEIKLAFQKDIDDEFVRQSQARISADVSAYNQTEELKSQRESLELKYQLIYATETEQKLAKISLEYSKKRKELENSESKSESQRQDLDRQEAIAKMMVTIEESGKRTQQVFDTVFGNLSSAIDNFVKTGKLSMKDLARSIIQDLIAIQMKAMVLRFLGGAFASFGGTASSYNESGGIAEHVFNPQKRADGGSITNNTPYLVGERGPELFMPSGSGTIIPNGQMGMGSTTNVTNNYINAIDVKSFEDRLLGSSNTIWAANQYANKNLSTNFGRT